MRQIGRKSSASLSVVPVSTEGRRPSPPAHLNAVEKKLWRDIVNSSPPGWFTVAQESLLAGFCCHASAAQFISKLIEKERPVDLTDRDKLRRYSRPAGDALSRNRGDVGARNADEIDTAIADPTALRRPRLGRQSHRTEALGPQTAVG